VAQAGLYALLGALVLASFVVPSPERSLARPSGRDELGQRALPLARAMTRLHDVEDPAPAGLASAEADSIAELIVGAASGEVVALLGGAGGREFARGVVNFDAAELRKIRGAKTQEIEQRLGYKSFDEVIHRDNLVIL